MQNSSAVACKQHMKRFRLVETGIFCFDVVNWVVSVFPHWLMHKLEVPWLAHLSSNVPYETTSRYKLCALGDVLFFVKITSSSERHPGDDRCDKFAAFFRAEVYLWRHRSVPRDLTEMEMSRGSQLLAWITGQLSALYSKCFQRDCGKTARVLPSSTSADIALMSPELTVSYVRGDG